MEYNKSIRAYGKEMAEKIAQRINEIKSIDNVEALEQFHIGGCHSLKGDRKGEYAMNLVQPFRLIFIKKETNLQIVKIIEIEDYH